MSARVEHGDCLEVMAALIAEGVQVDSCVCDPPYHLTSIVKRFSKTSRADDTKTSDRSRKGADGYARLSTGFMGKEWDGGDVAFKPETWRLVYDLLKPGGHLVAFSGTRTYHRMVCAIEDAGFEIRDQLAWMYGSGFPKSHDVSKGIDKAAGVDFSAKPASGVGFMGPDGPGGYNVTKNQLSREGESTEAAQQWEGWGTALKPAQEPIVLARKPLEGTVAANVLKHGTGAINIDGCRVGVDADDDIHAKNPHTEGGFGHAGSTIYGDSEGAPSYDPSKGRWPANIIHDGSDEVLDALARYGNDGRFFYSAKADKNDRLGSKHPTVKPIDLMAYLCRLITPPGGIVLDPFAGSGTTGVGAMRGGFNAILIEREAESVADIRVRLDHAAGRGPHSGSLKTRSKKKKEATDDHMPLFKGDAA